MKRRPGRWTDSETATVAGPRIARTGFDRRPKTDEGDAKAYGVHGFDFFTREKAITSRWLDPASRSLSETRGINLGFPQNK